MRIALLLLPVALVLPACSSGADPVTPAAVVEAVSEGLAQAVLRQPGAGSRVLPGTTAAEVAAAASSALWESAPVVVVAGEADPVAQVRAAALASELVAPLLLAAGPAAVEVARLEPQVLLAVGPAAQDWAAGTTDAEVVAVDPVGTEPASSLVDLELEQPDPVPGTVALAITEDAPGVATARSAGAQVLVVPDPDPRADGATVRQLAELAPAQVLGLGTAFGTDDRFADRVATAVTGVELPGGGQLVLPGKRYVALYGHPGSRALGVLGEQGPQASLARAAGLAEQYAAARPDATVIPTFEVITTVADVAAGPDGDYSAESTIDNLRPYVDVAAASGAYVLLDLQPGYTDFLTQAKRYEELLRLPHVGLALDPEWRLKPGQRHLQQIGTVSAAEVNAVGDWLSALVRENNLPQKMLLLHQFRVSMLQDRASIVADRDELAVVTQMDGHGPPSLKDDTWGALLRDAPVGMAFGWKNFYDEDSPTLTPAQTMQREPTPVFVSYQ